MDNIEQSDLASDLTPELQQPELDLTEHADGYWPSSKNITQ